ncbi:MAG: hypothetical protein HC892_10200 [Saprospiraceae bacterium]|nr:hypothetical protein [Saprospiraceae bacterium]
MGKRVLKMEDTPLHFLLLFTVLIRSLKCRYYSNQTTFIPQQPVNNFSNYQEMFLPYSPVALFGDSLVRVPNLHLNTDNT